MTSNEVIPIGKRGNETPKKSSPLKVVSPIIRKYSGQRKGRIKKKLKFPRILHGISGKQGKQLKPQLKVKKFLFLLLVVKWCCSTLN